MSFGVKPLFLPEHSSVSYSQPVLSNREVKEWKENNSQPVQTRGLQESNQNTSQMVMLTLFLILLHQLRLFTLFTTFLSHSHTVRETTHWLSLSSSQENLQMQTQWVFVEWKIIKMTLKQVIRERERKQWIRLCSSLTDAVMDGKPPHSFNRTSDPHIACCLLCLFWRAYFWGARISSDPICMNLEWIAP